MNLGLFLLILVAGSILLGALAAVLLLFSGSGSKGSKDAIEQMGRGLQGKLASLEEFTANLKRLLNERNDEIELLKKTEQELEEKAIHEISALKERTATQANVVRLEDELGKIKRAVGDLEQKLSLEISSMRQMPMADSASGAKLEQEFEKIKKTLEAIQSQSPVGASPAKSQTPEPAPKPEPVKGETIVPPAPPAAEIKSEQPVISETLKPSPPPVTPAPVGDKQILPDNVETAAGEPVKPAEPVNKSAVETPSASAAPSANGANSKAVPEETVDDILALLQGKKKS